MSPMSKEGVILHSATSAPASMAPNPIPTSNLLPPLPVALAAALLEPPVALPPPLVVSRALVVAPLVVPEDLAAADPELPLDAVVLVMVEFAAAAAEEADWIRDEREDDTP